MGRDHYACHPLAVCCTSARRRVHIPANQLVVFPEPIKERQRESERPVLLKQSRAQHKPSGTHRQKHLITHACSLTRTHYIMYSRYYVHWYVQSALWWMDCDVPNRQTQCFASILYTRCVAIEIIDAYIVWIRCVFIDCGIECQRRSKQLIKTYQRYQVLSCMVLLFYQWNDPYELYGNHI